MVTQFMRLLGQYRFALVLLGCVFGMVFWTYLVQTDRLHIHATKNVAPTPVIMGQAIVTEQGVQLDWLAAQPGIHPVSGYVIERSREGGPFEYVARVEKISLRFLDADGHSRDRYQIIAEDNQRPAGRSAASASVVAVAAKPGSTVVVESAPNSRVLGAAMPESTQSEAAEAIAALQERLMHLFAKLDADLSRKDFTAIDTYLAAMQDYQRQMLALWPVLSAAQRASSAGACAQQAGLFEANVHILPERAQLDGMLVMAGCSAMQESHT